MKRFKDAFKGILAAFKSQLNFRLQVLAAVLVTIAGFAFKITLVEWGLIAIAAGLVLTAEAVNTAIETLTDIVSPGYNEKAGRVKDIAAGAVLIAAAISVIIGVIIFLPKILQFF
ncbi:MAG: diacylglycerol kinase family protein [bacterium]|nr:diacylglycerol kinase family protein [bacterium]